MVAWNVASCDANVASSVTSAALDFCARCNLAWRSAIVALAASNSMENDGSGGNGSCCDNGGDSMDETSGSAASRESSDGGDTSALSSWLS